MRNSHSSLRNNFVCMMLYDLMGHVLYWLIWAPRFKSLSCYPGCRGNKMRRRLSVSEGNARSTAVVSLKIITPSAYQSWERGAIIYRDINSLRQSIEFYNLSVIGCIVPSAKATEFHVIKIKKGSKNMPLTTILAAIIFVSWHLYWPSRGRQAVSCAVIIIIIWIIINASSPLFQYTKISMFSSQNKIFSWPKSHICFHDNLEIYSEILLVLCAGRESFHQ